MKFWAEVALEAIVIVILVVVVVAVGTAVIQSFVVPAPAEAAESIHAGYHIATVASYSQVRSAHPAYRITCTALAPYGGKTYTLWAHDGNCRLLQRGRRVSLLLTANHQLRGWHAAQ